MFHPYLVPKSSVIGCLRSTKLLIQISAYNFSNYETQLASIEGEERSRRAHPPKEGAAPMEEDSSKKTPDPQPDVATEEHMAVD